MKAAVATGVGDVAQHLSVRGDWPRVTLASARDGKTGKPVQEIKGQRHMVVRVLACALAPGDARLFKGKTDVLQLPRWGRPYVIGSDACGIVDEVEEGEPYFRVGDKVVCRFDEPQPHGMCAEFACVKTHLSEKCPEGIPAIEACTLPASAAAARRIAKRFVDAGDRVLVLGASGGLGTFLCQYIKRQGAGFLAATTTQSELAGSLGVDRVINYRLEKWWEIEGEFSEEPFDLVVDLVNGDNWQRGGCSGTKVLSSNATYVQMLSGVETELDMSCGYLGMVPFVLKLLGRSVHSRCRRSCPKYETPQGLLLEDGDLKEVLEDVAEKRIRVVLEPKGPFSLETESVREAMRLQTSIHAHGKVVVVVAEEK